MCIRDRNNRPHTHNRTLSNTMKRWARINIFVLWALLEAQGGLELCQSSQSILESPYNLMDSGIFWEFSGIIKQLRMLCLLVGFDPICSICSDDHFLSQTLSSLALIFPVFSERISLIWDISNCAIVLALSMCVIKKVWFTGDISTMGQNYLLSTIIK